MHYGRLRDYRFSGQTIDDIRGSSIYGVNDDKLGKIDDVIFDHDSGDIRYVVVDTGGWLSSKKFIVPADRLRVSAKHKDDFEADLSKKQVESFPPYDENAVESQDRWTDYENRYRRAWSDSPIQHREGTDRNVTPSLVEQGSRNLGRRWSTFEDRLRADRVSIVGSCSVCSARPHVVERERQRKVS